MAKTSLGTTGLQGSAGSDNNDDDVRVATESLGAFSVTTEVLDDSSDLFSRFRSARNSPAVWQRRSRSFSSALLMVSSNFTGRSGRRRVVVVGVRLRIASVMTAEVSPRNGTTPVAIS